ncbi:MAG: hypothetical protein WAX89_06000 [Alphaproteobacteria bacterium]
MKTLMAALLMALAMFGNTSAWAGAHGEEEDLVAYAQHELEHRAQAFVFQVGRAIHGDHEVWRRMADDVVATATPFAAVPQVGQALTELRYAKACLVDVPTAALTDVSHPAHDACVHPVHDKVANLAALLEQMAPRARAVMALETRISEAKLMYGTQDICGYGDQKLRPRELDDVPEWHASGPATGLGLLLLAALLGGLAWAYRPRTA